MLSQFDLTHLPSLMSLYREINTDMGNSEIWFVLLDSCLMLAVHAVLVLGIAGAFHAIDSVMTKRRILGGSFISYFIAIFLVIAIHFAEIIVWAYICLLLKVFPSNPQTVFFAGEMYTTVGYGKYNLAEQWRILPIIISFSGIFAVSMSGAALFNMMGALIGHNKDDGHSKDESKAAKQ